MIENDTTAGPRGGAHSSRSTAPPCRKIVLLGDEGSAMRDIQGGSGMHAGREDTAASDPQSLKMVSRLAASAAERELISDTLDLTRWNRRKASKILGVSYKTLLTKMKELGLSGE